MPKGKVDKRVLKRPVLHDTQQQAFSGMRKFNVFRCGRRWGKNTMIEFLLVEAVRRPNTEISVISMDYPNLAKFWERIKNRFSLVTSYKSEQPPYIVTPNGCRIKLWSGRAIDSMRGDQNDLVFWDEAAHDTNLEYNWGNVVLPTLIDRQGGASFFSTPRGSNYFRVLDEKYLEDDKWASFHFTTYDNPLLNKKYIDMIASEMTEIQRKQEIYAEYVDISGAIIRHEWIQNVFELPTFDAVSMGVDLAISQKDTADYTAIVVMGRTSNGFYIVDVLRERLSFHETIQAILRLAEKWHVEIVSIESTAYQASVVQELRRTSSLNVREVMPDKDKVTRFLRLASRYENRLVFHYNVPATFVSELLAFPEGEHDDQCDAAVYALLGLDFRRPKAVWF